MNIKIGNFVRTTNTANVKVFFESLGLFDVSYNFKMNIFA